MYIGVGHSSQADDAAGIKLAEAMKEQGVSDVWLESEIEAQDGLEIETENRPLILLDVVDLQEAPGKVTLLPLQIVLQNSTLSHKILPVVSEVLNYSQMRNAYLLGIQAESLEQGRDVSPAVQSAMDQILKQLTN